MNHQDALVIVDVQNDFCPGGALAVENGDRVVATLNRWIERAQRDGARIVASRDWHPPHHVSFQEQGGPWPTHCLQQTRGAEFHPDLRLPEDSEIVSKGMRQDADNYSAFDNTALADELQHAGVERVWIGGLAEDICVRQTALDARKAGFEVHLIEDATLPVDPQQSQEALEEMKNAGVILESSIDISPM